MVKFLGKRPPPRKPPLPLRKSNGWSWAGRGGGLGGGVRAGVNSEGAEVMKIEAQWELYVRKL